jgi:hypothetical protein
MIVKIGSRLTLGPATPASTQALHGPLYPGDRRESMERRGGALERARAVSGRW